MATPGSGAISMNDMRTHINRATSSSISMSEMRTRYGGSGSISFSDLRSCEGFTVTCNTYTFSSKFFSDTYHGWEDDLFGSISPDEGNGRLEFATNSWLQRLSESISFGTTTLNFEPNSTGFTANGDQVTSGFKTTNVTRVVTANTSQSITSATSNSTFSALTISYDVPTSGTIHCLVKF